jgi:uncharacterized SAM-binding protein YcdF (DUF218 family)
MTVAANSQEHSPPAGTGQRFRRTWRAVWFACVTVMVVLIAGFFYFASLIQRTANVEGVPADADGIIVLTGGSERINDAISLLRDERGDRLLISGVNPLTTAGQTGPSDWNGARTVQLLHRSRLRRPEYLGQCCRRSKMGY